MSRMAIVLTITAFYVVLIVMFGLIGMGDQINNKLCPVGNLEQKGGSSCLQETNNGVSIWDYTTFFFGGIGIMISSIPLWANMILFVPLGATMLWGIMELIS